MEKINLAKNVQYRSDKSGPTQEIHHVPSPPTGDHTGQHSHSNGNIIYSSPLIRVKLVWLTITNNVHHVGIVGTPEISYNLIGNLKDIRRLMLGNIRSEDNISSAITEEDLNQI